MYHVLLISFGGEGRSIQIMASRDPPRTGREEEAVPSIGPSHLQGRSFPEGDTSPQEKVRSRR